MQDKERLAFSEAVNSNTSFRSDAKTKVCANVELRAEQRAREPADSCKNCTREYVREPSKTDLLCSNTKTKPLVTVLTTHVLGWRAGPVSERRERER